VVIRRDLPFVRFYTYTVVLSDLSCTSCPHPSINCDRSEATHYTLSSAYAFSLIYFILSRLILSCLILSYPFANLSAANFSVANLSGKYSPSAILFSSRSSAALAWRWWPGQTVRVWSPSYECLGFKGASGVERVCVGRVRA